MRWPAWPRRRDAARGVGGHRCPGWPSWSPRRPRPAWSATPHGVGPVQMVDRPQRICPGRLGPAPELGDLGGRAGRTDGTTAVTHEFSLRGGGEDQPELRSLRLHFLPGSHRHSRPMRGFRTIRLCLAGPARDPSPPTGAASMTETVQRAAQMALPSSSVRVMPHTCKVLPDPHRCGRGRQVSLAQGAQVAGVEFDADDALARPGGEGGAEAGGRLGEQRGDTAVEDAVGLMHLPVHGQAKDHSLRCGLEHLDAEEAVDAGGRADPGHAQSGGGGGSGHRRMITVHR